MSTRQVSLPEVLEAMVAVVATLGELVATVTAPRRRLWPLLYPESLHRKLREFILTLWDALDHPDVNLLGQSGVTSLDQAMATLEATPAATRADVRAAVRAWQGSMDALNESWHRVYREAEEISITLKGEGTAEATNEDPAEATATGLAGDLRDETPPGRGTAGNSLVAAAPQPSLAPPSAVAAHDVPVATGQAGTATRRGQRVEEARELLEHLVGVCCKARALPLELLRGLGHIEAALEGTEEVSCDVPKALAAMVAKTKLLCEASARLARRHLLVTLGEIQNFLESPYGGSGGPSGPRGRAVAEQCQRAIEDIPRLLEDIDVTAVTSSGQWCHWGDLWTLECHRLLASPRAPRVPPAPGVIRTSCKRNWRGGGVLVPPRAPRVSPGPAPPPCEGPRGLSLCHTPPSDTHRAPPRPSGPPCTRTSPSLKHRDPRPSSSSSSSSCSGTPPRAPGPGPPLCPPSIPGGLAPPLSPPGNSAGTGGARAGLGGHRGVPSTRGGLLGVGSLPTPVITRVPPQFTGCPQAAGLPHSLPPPSPTPPKALGPPRSMSPPQCARNPHSPPLPHPWDPPLTVTPPTHQDPPIHGTPPLTTPPPSALPGPPSSIEPPGTPPAPPPSAPPSPRPALGPAGAGLAPPPGAPSSLPSPSGNPRTPPDRPSPPGGAGLAPPPGAATAWSRPMNAEPTPGHAHRGAGPSRADNERPWSVPRVSPADMEPRKELEVQVAMVAILASLAATVTVPHKDNWPLLYPKSLHRHLWRLTRTLWDTLRHIAVTSLRQVLAILKATPRPTWADVRTAHRVWQESVNVLQDRWGRVYWDAMDIFVTLEGEDMAEATNKDPAEATATGVAGDLRDESPPGRGTAGDTLVAVAPQPSVALPSAVAAHDVPVATGQVGAATRRGQRVKEARELLGRFLVACNGGTRFLWGLDYWLKGIMGSEEWRKQLFSDDPEAALAVAKHLCGAERLWEASARLARRHLLGTTEEIYKFLWSFCVGPGSPRVLFACTVAERCQRAIKDIPRLLGEQ